MSEQHSLYADNDISVMINNHLHDERPDEESDIEDGTEESQSRVELQPSDFYFGSTLGEGAYARVVHAKSKKTDEQFAVKIMEKVHIKRENKVKQVMTERAILATINHPFLVRFFFSFQDAGYLYMCMELAPGGELLSLITTKQDEKLEQGIENEACDFSLTQYYMAEVVEALEYLHNNRIIHRDLKPENILLSAYGHVKITDFGTSCRVEASSSGGGGGGAEDDNSTSSPRTSFVGTQDYVSPEVLAGDRRATKACDLWALGCMIFQMLSGKSPFREATEYLTFESIMGHCRGTRPLEYPVCINDMTRDLISALLRQEEAQRLGAAEMEDDEVGGNGYKALKAHPFFEGVAWGELTSREYGLYVPDETKFPSAENMRDGALDEWQFEGDPTPIMTSGGHYGLMNDSDYCMHDSDIVPIMGGEDSGDDFAEEIDSEIAAVLHKAGVAKRRASGNAKWHVFLQAGEKEIFSGLVYKRKGLFSKKRYLILTDTPRLIYADPETMELKGEIPWTLEHPVHCHKKSNKEFDICCRVSGRAYHMSDSTGGSETWVQVINTTVECQRVKRIVRQSVVLNTAFAVASGEGDDTPASNGGGSGDGSGGGTSAGGGGRTEEESRLTDGRSSGTSNASNSAGAHDSESLSTSEVHVSAPGDVLNKAAGTGALVGTGAGEAAGKGAPGVDGPEGTIPHPTDSSSRPNSATDVEAEIEAQIEAGELQHA